MLPSLFDLLFVKAALQFWFARKLDWHDVPGHDMNSKLAARPNATFILLPERSRLQWLHRDSYRAVVVDPAAPG